MAQELVPEDMVISDRRSFDERHMREIGRDAGREGGRMVLVAMGIDPDDAESMRDWNADLTFLRNSRKQSEHFYGSIKLTLIAALLTAASAGMGWLATFLFPPRH